MGKKHSKQATKAAQAPSKPTQAEGSPPPNQPTNVPPPKTPAKAQGTTKPGGGNCFKRPKKEQPIGIAPPPASEARSAELPPTAGTVQNATNATLSSKQPPTVQDEKGPSPLTYEQLCLKREILVLKEAIKQATFENTLLLDMFVITQLDGDELNNLLEDMGQQA